MLKSAAEGEILLWVLLPTLNTFTTVSHSWHPASQDSWSEPRLHTPGCYIKNRYNHLISISWLFPPYLGKVSVRDVYLGRCSQPHTDSHSPAVAGRSKAVLFLYYNEAEVGARCAYEGTCTLRHLHRAQVSTAQGNSYWVNGRSGLRHLSTQTCFWCPDLALNSLSQVWGFESPA